jgi:endonuclease III
MTLVRKEEIWVRLQSRMTKWCATWRDHVSETAVPSETLRKRMAGSVFSDEEVFEALVLAILSNQTDWRTIKNVRHELKDRFDGYDFREYGKRSDEQIEPLVSWFKERRAGSQTRRNDLRRLRDTAKLLGETNSMLDLHFIRCIEQHENNPHLAVFALGRESGWKLPGFGPALSAEALRNLGYDIAKPDRHVLRAVGQWGLVEFKRWTDKSNRRAPPASDLELQLAMDAIRDFAVAVGERVTFTDSVIWTACAKGGAWLTNDELREISCVDYE